MKKTLSLNPILLSTILVGVFLTSVTSSLAQETGKSLTIIPPKFELFANPSDTVTENIRVRNESDFPATYTLLVEDFSSSGEEGQVVLEEEVPVTSFSLAKWIELETKDIVLQPKEEKTLGFTIRIPRDAEPGGHYASVLFQSTVDAAVPGAANISQRIGTLVLLRVSGNVTEQASINTFEAPKYNQNTPVNFTLRIQNQGNTHMRPKGTIIITNMFGKKIDEIPLEGSNVLPGAVRKMDTSWTRQNVLGYYTATLVATYGQQNLPLTGATKFLVASPTALILIGIGLVGAFMFISSAVAGRSRLLKAIQIILTGK